MKGKVITLEWRVLIDTTLTKGSTVASPVINHVDNMYPI